MPASHVQSNGVAPEKHLAASRIKYAVPIGAFLAEDRKTASCYFNKTLPSWRCFRAARLQTPRLPFPAPWDAFVACRLILTFFPNQSLAKL
jgi:hypothetical protein